MNVKDRYENHVLHEYVSIMEEKIMLVINDKPWWIPQRIWLWMVATTLKVEIHSD